ncbi:MAG: hypothetical protein Q7T87_09420 [Polaromonas sp.]|nr:hypothetical protein [Polaromonas sp.]
MQATPRTSATAQGWLAGIGSLVTGWRGRASRHAGGRLEEARQTMLRALDEAGAASLKAAAPDPRWRRLRLRIGLCRDASSLWFLRSELMQAMSSSLGEHIASVRMADINALFDGLLPASLHSRPAPLR